MIFFGWFADAYGRIPATLASNMIALLSGVLTPALAATSTSTSFLVMRFIMGLACNTFFTMPYILGEVLDNAIFKTLHYLRYLIST